MRLVLLGITLLARESLYGQLLLKVPVPVVVRQVFGRGIRKHLPRERFERIKSGATDSDEWHRLEKCAENSGSGEIDAQRGAGREIDREDYGILFRWKLSSQYFDQIGAPRTDENKTSVPSGRASTDVLPKRSNRRHKRSERYQRGVRGAEDAMTEGPATCSVT